MPRPDISGIANNRRNDATPVAAALNYLLGPGEEIFDQTFNNQEMKSIAYTDLPNLSQSGFDAAAARYSELLFEFESRVVGADTDVAFFEERISVGLWNRLPTTPTNEFNRSFYSLGNRELPQSAGSSQERRLRLYRDVDGFTFGERASDDGIRYTGRVKVYGLR